MTSNHARDNFHLMLKVRKPLTSCEQMDREANDAWLVSVQELITAREDGSYPWQEYVLGDGTVVKHKTLDEYISSDDGLRTSPTRMLKLLEADTLPGASEVAEKLRAALTPGPGNPTGANQWTGGKVDNVNLSSSPKKATGNSKARLIREIRQLSESDAPNALLAADLLERVHRSEISANKAAIQLGLRNRVVNFDLNKLTSEVRSEIDNIKEQEDWTTAEVLEEALRAYFRVLNAEEPDDPQEPVIKVQPSAPVADTSSLHNRANPPEGFLRGIDVADICGVNRNSLSAIVKKFHDQNKDAELSTEDGKRMFIRRPSQKFWEEIQ